MMTQGLVFSSNSPNMKFKFILIFDCDGHDSDCYSPMGFYISLSDSLLSWKRKKLASKSGLLK